MCARSRRFPALPVAGMFCFFTKRCSWTLLAFLDALLGLRSSLRPHPLAHWRFVGGFSVFVSLTLIFLLLCFRLPLAGGQIPARLVLVKLKSNGKVIWEQNAFFFDGDQNDGGSTIIGGIAKFKDPDLKREVEDWAYAWIHSSNMGNICNYHWGCQVGSCCAVIVLAVCVAPLILKLLPRDGGQSSRCPSVSLKAFLPLRPDYVLV